MHGHRTQKKMMVETEMHAMLMVTVAVENAYTARVVQKPVFGEKKSR